MVQLIYRVCSNKAIVPADLYKISLDELIGRRTLITEESSYEQQILNVVETMDDTKKELSLRLLNEVAQQRGDKDGE